MLFVDNCRHGSDSRPRRLLDPSASGLEATRPVGLQVNDHIAAAGDVVFRHACQLGFEGIVSKRLGSPYISGRSRAWLKFKNPAAPAVKREAEEDWGKKWR
jgi:ATP-dependent DNA ligase